MSLGISLWDTGRKCKKCKEGHIMTDGYNEWCINVECGVFRKYEAEEYQILKAGSLK